MSLTGVIMSPGEAVLEFRVQGFGVLAPGGPAGRCLLCLV